MRREGIEPSTYIDPVLVGHADRDTIVLAPNGYRLKDAVSGVVQSEAWIDVPQRSGFALPRAWYASRQLWLDVSRARGESRARVDLIDSGGRRVLMRALTIDDTRQPLSIPCRVPSGIYFVRLTQGASSASGKVIVLE